MTWSIREFLLDAKGGQQAWREYVEAAFSIPAGGHPFHAYVGFNFTATGLKNFKFYFAYYRPLKPRELKRVLPVGGVGRLEEFLAQWHPTRKIGPLHRGVTFALKVDANGTLTHYWHLRVKGLPLGPPERLAIQPSDRENFHGVCEEFSEGKTHLKRYFYLHNPDTIRQSLAAAGMPDRTAVIDALEYIESDGRDKFSWVTRDPRLCSRLVAAHAESAFVPVLRELCETTQQQLYAPGSSTDGKDHALYLVNPTPVTQFDGIRPLLTRYLGL